jgi:small subunit ribosomal protein S2
MFQKEVEKLNKFVGGIKNMDSLPNLIIVINPVNEKNAIAEAIKLNIPVVAISNSNASPEKINFLIPGNSSSQKSLVLLVSILCDAIAEANGKETRVVGKADADIILPEVAKKVQEESIVSHNKSSYGYRNYDNRNQGYDNKNQNFNSKK